MSAAEATGTQGQAADRRDAKGPSPGAKAPATKQGLSNVDVAALAAELGPVLTGARVDRVYQSAKDRILVRFRKTGAGRTDVLFELGTFLVATRRAPENPDKPSMLAQTLRSQLENSRVLGLHQVGFDRILRLDVERGDGRRSLVFELFGDGNLLLLDAAGTILLPMRGEDYAARKLRKGEPYVPPPSGGDPFALDRAALQAASGTAKRDVVRWLALDLGFGPLWAEELCLRAGLDKKALPTDLAADAWDRLHAELAKLGAELRGNLLAPVIVHHVEAPVPSAPSTQLGSPPAAEPAEPITHIVDASPFPLKRYPPPRFSQEEATSFSAALDACFLGAGSQESEAQEPEDPRQARLDDAIGKVQRQVDQTEEAITRLQAEEREAQRDGEAIYASFPQVEAILAQLTAARAGRSWADVERILAEARAAGDARAQRIPALRPHEGTAVFRLAEADGTPRDVEVDLRLNVQDNAQRHFATAKKARSRREGAQQARLDALGRLRDVQRKGLDAFGAAPVREVKLRHHFWFESYRWTLTPSGLLAVGGRSAAQNDAVVKKYLRDGDRYVHADIHGAPSVVVRPYDAPRGDATDEDLQVAGQFAVASSRAWRLGAPGTAYWVTPNQVSKTPRSGEFVPRGAWIIHGRRNPIGAGAMAWSVGPVTFTSAGVPLSPEDAKTYAGRTLVKLVGGPRAGLAPWGADVVRLEPGTLDPNLVAVRLAKHFGVAQEEAQAALPPGPLKVVSGLADADAASLELDEPDASENAEAHEGPEAREASNRATTPEGA